MRDGWAPLTLGDIMTLEYGKALKEADRDGGKYPVYGSAGQVGWHSAHLGPDGPMIVVGRKGTAGSVHWSSHPGWPIDTAYWVRPLIEDLDFRFLFLLLEHLDLPAVCAQTGVPGLNRDRAYELPATLPPLDEQRRIVDLIDSVDGALREAAETRAKAEAVWESFIASEVQTGDSDVEVGALIERIDAGKSPTASERIPEPGERGVLKVSAVQRNRFDPTQVKTLDPRTLVPEATRLVRGDILMTRANGVLERVGQVCRVDAAPADYFICDKTLRLVPNRKRVDPNWLVAALLSPQARQQIEALTTGSDMRNISQKAIRAVRLGVPSLAIQESLGEVAGALSALAHSAHISTARLRQLRSALLGDLLSGEHEIPESYDTLLESV